MKCLAKLLPCDLAHQTVADYYSASIQIYPTPFSLHHFQHWLLSSLQLPPLRTTLPLVKCIHYYDHPIFTSVQSVNVPVLRLFKATQSDRCLIPPPLSDMQLVANVSLVQFRRRIIDTLHLVCQVS